MQPTARLITTAKLFNAITSDIIQREPFCSVPFSEALELIAVWSHIVTTTDNGEGESCHRIARRLMMPRTTLYRRLRTLINSGHIGQSEKLYVAMSMSTSTSLPMVRSG